MLQKLLPLHILLSFLARVLNLFSVCLPAPYPLWMLPAFLLWVQLSLVSDTSDLPEWIDHWGGLYFAEQHSFCFFDHEGGSQWMTVVVLQCPLPGMFVGQLAENCFKISHALSPFFLLPTMFSHLCSHLSHSNKPCCLMCVCSHFQLLAEDNCVGPHQSQVECCCSCFYHLLEWSID